MEERLRSHYESLSRVIRFTRTADAKAAPVLALQVALLGALATRFEELYAVIAEQQRRDSHRTTRIATAGQRSSEGHIQDKPATASP